MKTIFFSNSLGTVVINALVVNQKLPATAEVRNVIKTKVHELFKLIDLPTGQISNVCKCIHKTCTII